MKLVQGNFAIGWVVLLRADGPQFLDFWASYGPIFAPLQNPTRDQKARKDRPHRVLPNTECCPTTKGPLLVFPHDQNLKLPRFCGGKVEALRG
jgi:hypothetical protein